MKGELLLIEDSHNTQMIVSKILERHGYALQAAMDGVSGLKKLEEMRPRVVLLDISLPEMDGMEIARRVRDHQSEEIRNTVLIALTAMGTTGDRDRFYDAGCDDHLPKPFRAVQLVEIVDAYMSPDFVPGKTLSPGARRREKLKEMAALKTAAVEGDQRVPAEPQIKAAPGGNKNPSIPADPAPKKEKGKKTRPAAKKDFNVRDDFLSDLLDPGSMEPVDPSKDED
jgi:CheY-like chemotaxis protein